MIELLVLERRALMLYEAVLRLERQQKLQRRRQFECTMLWAISRFSADSHQRAISVIPGKREL